MKILVGYFFSFLGFLDPIIGLGLILIGIFSKNKVRAFWYGFLFASLAVHINLLIIRNSGINKSINDFEFLFLAFCSGLFSFGFHWIRNIFYSKPSTGNDEAKSLDTSEDATNKDLSIEKKLDDVPEIQSSSCLENSENDYEVDVLSVAAGKTKHLIDRFQIHSCPDYYKYMKPRYITFRSGKTGEMDALYKINKILMVPGEVRENIEMFSGEGLSPDERERLKKYIKESPFPNNDRYYVLSRAIEMPHRPRPSEFNAKTIYYSLEELL